MTKLKQILRETRCQTLRNSVVKKFNRRVTQRKYHRVAQKKS